MTYQFENRLAWSRCLGESYKFVCLVWMNCFNLNAMFEFECYVWYIRVVSVWMPCLTELFQFGCHASKMNQFGCLVRQLNQTACNVRLSWINLNAMLDRVTCLPSLIQSIWFLIMTMRVCFICAWYLALNLIAFDGHSHAAGCYCSKYLIMPDRKIIMHYEKVERVSMDHVGKKIGIGHFAFCKQWTCGMFIYFLHCWTVWLHKTLLNCGMLCPICWNLLHVLSDLLECVVFFYPSC